MFRFLFAGDGPGERLVVPLPLDLHQELEGLRLHQHHLAHPALQLGVLHGDTERAGLVTQLGGILNGMIHQYKAIQC